MIKLSIIIPAFNAEPYIDELLNGLAKQLIPEVEIIVVDDGSDFPFLPPYPSIRVFRHDANKGVSAARNTGLDNARGKYIAFIDADDKVAEDYIPTILAKIDTEHFDYCYLSWKCFGPGWKCDISLKSIYDEFPPYNLCVWNRIYCKDMIGSVRFNEKKAIAEDAQFIRDVKEEGKKKAFISEYMYFYRTGHRGNLSDRFNQGNIDFKRTVYHYDHITSDMTWLIDEIAEKDKEGEVIILTNQNDIPELNNHAMILPPRHVKGTEFKGEPTSLFEQIKQPIRTQVVIWKHFLIAVGGIETWIYNFCVTMKEYYDIMVVYDKIDTSQLIRLSKHVQCIQNTQQKIFCDTIIINQLNDELPTNIIAKHRIRLTHTCRMVNFNLLEVPKDCEHNFFVSETARDTFGEDGEVIQNIPGIPSDSKALLLVSATRLTDEKGFGRMCQLANMLDKEQIPFVWLVFTADQRQKFPPNIIRMSPTLDIYPYLRMADYLVQLSDVEAFCYTIQESLQVGTPVIATPLGILKEFGISDGKNGYVLPFDMQNIDLQKIYNKRPKVSYKAPLDDVVQKWRTVLGNSTPTHDYEYTESMAQIVCTRRYKDIILNRIVVPGEIQVVTTERAQTLLSLGVIRYI